MNVGYIMRVDKETEKKLAEQGYTYIVGMNPVIFDGAKTLILGTLPGEKSLELGQYYADRRNKFWSLMADIFKIQCPVSIKDKEAFLKEHKIALWDVYHDGYRKGSSDKNGIKYGTPNKIKELMKKYPTIKNIVVVSKAAKKEYLSSQKLDIEPIFVTSTSGGNGCFNRQKQSWYEIDY